MMHESHGKRIQQYDFHLTPTAQHTSSMYSTYSHNVQHMKIKLKCVYKDLACSTYMTIYIAMHHHLVPNHDEIAELIQCICIVLQQLYIPLFWGGRNNREIKQQL